MIMKRMRQLPVLLMIVLITMGVGGCMSDNKQSSAERMREKALEYLNMNYDDTFTAKGYASSNWAYEYETITFAPGKYSDSIVEVIAYKNDDGSYVFKDDYFKCYMQSDARTYFAGLLEDTICSIKIRFPDAIWSDELGNATSFEEWKNLGSCEVDIFVFTSTEVKEELRISYVNKVASDKIEGTVTFFTTSDDELLADYNLDEILNNQSEYVGSKCRYYINENYEVEDNR